MKEKKKSEKPKEEVLEEVIEETTQAVEGDVVEDVVEEKTDEETQEDEKEKKLAEAIEATQRIAAEYYNYRERTSKEKASMYNDGVRDTVEKILPVIDNLERAISVQKDKAEEDDSFFKGVEMVLKQFKEILTSMGVEEIPALGEKFDPNLHSAVSHIEDENFGENQISIEMMKGYKLKDKVIRHSMVQVAN